MVAEIYHRWCRPRFWRAADAGRDGGRCGAASIRRPAGGSTRNAGGVVIVERLGWLDDAPDATLNGGSVEFATDETARQICIVVTAQTGLCIGGRAKPRPSAGLRRRWCHDLPVDRVVQSGVRAALDWREPVRLPIETGHDRPKGFMSGCSMKSISRSREPGVRRRRRSCALDVDKAPRGPSPLIADPTAETLEASSPEKSSRPRASRRSRLAPVASCQFQCSCREMCAGDGGQGGQEALFDVRWAGGSQAMRVIAPAAKRKPLVSRV